MIGEVKVRYSHYCKPFKVVDGQLDWRAIDEEYCISFVFKGSFWPKLMPEAAGNSRVPKLEEGAEPIFPAGDGLRKSVDDEGEDGRAHAP